MSTETSGDVCQIKDEDVLRQMWQDTEDFGKKKEIRSHMYKLREERLRNFYSASDLEADVHSTTEIHRDSSLKDLNRPNHAQSLLDQSFLSMKTKEIRDSESPSKDVHHFRTSSAHQPHDHGWEVTSKNEVSNDGKTHTLTKTATTSGEEKVNKGVVNYSAKCEQQASVFEDGDKNNYTKSSSASSKSVLNQEAKGGDDTSQYHSRSTSSSSSSKTVTQHRSESDFKPLPSTDDSTVIVRRTYTTDVPADLKRNPNYIDGNTTVTTETRTLADGSKVTTTRYETKGVSSKVSEQKFHTKQESDNSYQIVKQGHTTTHTTRDVPTTDVHVVTNSDSKNIKETSNYKENIRRTHQKNDDFDGTQHVKPNESTVINTRRETVVKDDHDTLSTTKTGDADSCTTTVKTTKIVREYIPDHRQPQSKVDSTNATKTFRKKDDTDVVTTVTTTKNVEEYPSKPKYISDTNIEKTTLVRNTDDINTASTVKVIKTVHENDFTSHDVHPSRKTVNENNFTSHEVHPSRKTVNENNFTSHEVHPSRKVPDSNTFIEDNIKTTKTTYDRTPTPCTPGEFTPAASTPGNQTPVNPNTYEKIQPQDIISKLSSKPVDHSPVDKNIYETTYTTETTNTSVKPITEKVTSVTTHTTHKTDYTSKRISVDISPTHDAFARSLRASPDREQKRGSTRNLKSSTSSLRSSVSPDKRYPEPCDSTSPDRKHPSPGTKTTSKKTNHQEINTNTITRRNKTDTYTQEEKRTYKEHSKSPSPTTRDKNVKKYEIVTDLDIEDVVVTKNRKPSGTSHRPTSLEFNKHPARQSPSDSSPVAKTSPSPNKMLDKPLKRRDTYEERCRQILGISEQTTDIKKTTERTNSRKSLTETTQKIPKDRKTISSPDQHERPDRNSPEKSKPKSERPQKLSPKTEQCNIKPKEPKSQTLKDTDDYYIMKNIREKNILFTSTEKPDEKKRPTPEDDSTDEDVEHYTTDYTTTTRRTKNHPTNEPHDNEGYPYDDRTTKNIRESQITTTQVTETKNKNYVSDRKSPTKTQKIPDHTVTPHKPNQDESVHVVTKQTNVDYVEKTDYTVDRKLPKPTSQKPLDKSPHRLPSGTTTPERPRQIKDNKQVNEELEEYYVTSKTTVIENENRSPSRGQSPTKSTKSPDCRPTPTKQTNSSINKTSVTEYTDEYTSKTPRDQKPDDYYNKKKLSEQSYVTQTTNTFDKKVVKPRDDVKKPTRQKAVDITTKTVESTNKIRKEQHVDVEETESEEEVIVISDTNPRTPFTDTCEIPKNREPEETDTYYLTREIIVKDTNSKPTERKPTNRDYDGEVPNDFVENTNEMIDHRVISSTVTSSQPKFKPTENTEECYITTESDEDVGITKNRKSTNLQEEYVQIDNRITKTNQRVSKDSTYEKTPTVKVEKTPGTKISKHPQNYPSNETKSKVVITENYGVTDRKVSTTRPVKHPVPTDERMKNRKPVAEPSEDIHYVTDSRTHVKSKHDERITTTKTVDSTKPNTISKHPKISDNKPKNLRQSPDENYEITVDKCYNITSTDIRPNRKSQSPVKPKDSSKSPERLYRINQDVNERHVIQSTKVVENSKSTRPKLNTQHPVQRKSPEKGVNRTDVRLTETKHSRVTEYQDEYCSPKKKDKVPSRKPDLPETRVRKPVEEVFTSKKTYLTASKDTVHRLPNKSAPKKPDNTERIRPVKEKNRKEIEEHTSDEETTVINGNSREHSLSPVRTQKIPKENEDFYTLNIQVYKTDSNITSRSKPSKNLKPNESPSRKQPNTIYCTEKKHDVNKYVKPTDKINTYRRDDTSEERTVSKTTQKVTSTRRSTTAKPETNKPQFDQKRHVVTTTIQVVPKTKQPDKRKPATKTPVKVTKPANTKKPQAPTEYKNDFQNYETDEESDEEQEHIPVPGDTMRKPDKVVTTKSIIINNDFENQQVVVNLQRSKSSRETTPDRIGVYPASDYDDKDMPRYPDNICEPDDSYRRSKPTKLSDIPIIETDDFETSRSHKVDEKDECLLSVNEKVNLFIREADKLTTQKKTDKLDASRDVPARPKSPRCEKYPEDETFTSVSEKVSHFTETAGKREPSQKPFYLVPKGSRPKFTDGSVTTEEFLQRESDEVNQTTVTSKTDRKSSTTKVVQPSYTTECVQIDSEEDMYTRTPKQRESSPVLSKSPTELNSTPKTSRKVEPKAVLSTTGRMRSTESIRKAKEIFESFSKDTKTPTSKDDKCELKSTRLVMDKLYPRQSPTKDGDVPGYMRPLNRSPRPHSPHVERSQSPKDRSRSSSVDRHPRQHSPSLDEIPHYMWPLDRTSHDHDSVRSQSTEREHSPKRHEPIPCKEKFRHKTNQDIVDKPSKVGGSPHKTDLKKSTRKLTITEIENILVTHEIEEIYDIYVLEILLERAVNYEQRRRIRAQIRIVKQLTIDNKLPNVLIKEVPRTEKVRERSVEKSKAIKTTTEQTTYTQRRQSSDVRITTKETTEIRKSPERKPENKKVVETKTVSLKRVEPTKTKMVQEQPSWVTQRPLKKSSGDVPKTKSTLITTKKQSDSRASPSKERKPTDDITSSYGVGPTDENGRPLFGLKALKARTTTGTTKVQGTVIESHYYSENGQEPVGEISVTKYSTDPNDFEEHLVDKNEGVLSVTTTKKFGGRGTPTSKAIKDKQDYCEKTEHDQGEITVTRRGSVKQMSKKFIENTVEALKNEKQSSYPKAGLILRTSSFKKSNSRENSPENDVITTTVRQTSSSTSEGQRRDTFLNSQKRVTNVQEVITRMKNSECDVEEGDTVEDVEARKLLNKFIGSQVILSGMESSTTPSVERSVARTTTTTTTLSKGGGKPTVVSRTFTHPITEEDLDTVWDEQTLKLLLERSTSYEERRIIRGRLRDVMAEKEDANNSTEESSGRVEGESLLLPLLQGLLDAPDNEQTADSGTESGEDLRNGLLIEVQNVLGKLANSLRSSSNDMSEERRNSLLTLVAKLQTGLSQPSTKERRSSGHERFSKKRRHNRHTVGVTSEELEDARKLIEEMGLYSSKSDKPKLQDQISVPTTQNTSIIKNVVAKPYHSPGSTSQSASCTSSTVNTPTEVTGVLQFSNPLTPGKVKEHKFAQYEQIKQKPYAEVLPSRISTHNEVKPRNYQTEDGFVTIGNKPMETPNVMLQNNPIYSKPTTFPEVDDQKLNRFNNKKLKLKRANTIDIPKPANTYESEDDYDSDTSLVDKQSTRRNNYLALRGPIRVGRNSIANTNVPVFEPKTESDRKFMAFINKHNDKADSSSLWAHQGQELNNKGNNWNNRFGNIRTAFEKATVLNSITPTPMSSSARNFWKRTENAENNLPRSKFPQRRSEYIINEKDEIPKIQRSTPIENEVVTGSLKVDVNKNYRFLPQPLPVNKFSHAPTSAFAAIPQKNFDTKSNVPENVIKSDFQNTSEPSTPLYLYSPKPLQNTGTSFTSSLSPSDHSTIHKPTATKFGHSVNNEIGCRKTYSNPVFNNVSSENVEKVAAPYIAKSIENANTVKRLSDQFNNKLPKQPSTYLTAANLKSTYSVPKYSVCSSSDYSHNPSQSCDVYNAYVQPKNLPAQVHQKQHIAKQPHDYKSVVTVKQPKIHEDFSSHSYLKLRPPSKPESDVSSSDSSPVPQQYNRQTSQESVKEYEAAVSKVMKGPVSQQAVTVQQNSPRGREQHDLEVALNLRNVLQKFAEKSPERKLSIDSNIKREPNVQTNLHRKSQSFKTVPQHSNPNFMINGNPLSMESTEINENGESVITSKFHIPVTIQSTVTKSPTLIRKADLWNQLMYDQQQLAQKPAPISSPNSKSVQKSKSSHSLAVPTVQFQASMTRDEVAQKKKFVAAYFSGNVSPQTVTPSDDSPVKSDKTEVKANKSSVNRKKTSEKISVSKHSIGVARSQTLPNIACPNLLDEKTIKESGRAGSVTTTQVTRIASQQVSKKPLSPFAKFRQLDKQNSLNTPPGTPRTPTGSTPLFKFTDPELSRQASTVKERLLQWCQMKTKEYENVQLDNFSSSWADGLAFCALIHHFMPDAFDYQSLKPENRKHNFTLAFRIADEKANIVPLLDVEDMIATRKPDWKCVFTYVQTIYARFKNED